MHEDVRYVFPSSWNHKFADEVLVGVISVLNAGTNDLAQLINHLDLEATTGTPQDHLLMQ